MENIDQNNIFIPTALKSAVNAYFQHEDKLKWYSDFKSVTKAVVSPTANNNLFKIQIQQNWMCLKESKLCGDPISNSLHMYVVCFSALKLWELSTNQYRYA